MPLSQRGGRGASAPGGKPPAHSTIGSFSPFTVMTVLINPYRFAERNYQADPTYGFGNSDIASSRLVVFVVSWIAVGVYALVVWSMYKSMVKNFDMTIRRQSR